jgi:hypothetical protein
MEIGKSGKLAGLSVGLSIACAVHCAALPLLAGAAAVSSPHGHGPGDTWLEASLVGTAALIGILTLGPAYLRHRSPVPLAFLLLGLSILFAGHACPAGYVSRAAGIVGALALVAAQVLNRRQGACCGAHSH